MELESLFSNSRGRVVDGFLELLPEPPETLHESNDSRNPVVVSLPYLAQDSYRGEQRRQLGLTDRDLGQHVLKIGATGSGKSNAFCFTMVGIRDSMGPNDLAFVFDPNGDYRRRFFRPGDLVIGAGKNLEKRWNILAEIWSRNSREEIDELALNEICHGLFRETADHPASNPFFDKAGRIVCKGAMWHLARDRANTNARLRAFWDSKLLQEIHGLLASDPRTRGLLNFIPINAEQQTAGVIALIKGVIEDVLQAGFAEPGDISIRAEVRRKGGRFVFLDYDVAASSTIDPGYSILLDLAISEALRVGQEAKEASGKPNGRVWFILDEFSRLPRLRQLEKGLTYGRGLNLRFILGTQNHGQIKSTYGEGAASILSALNLVFAFRVADADTRNWIQGFGGRTRRILAVRGERFDPTETVFEANTVEDKDMLCLEPGEAIAFIPKAKSPFKIKFPLYDAG